MTPAAPKKSPFNLFEKRPPLGVGSLISVTRDAGHKIFFIDNFLKPSKFIEEGYLQRNNIDFIGISANNICCQDTKRMLNNIQDLRRQGLWNGKIILGGPLTSVSIDKIPDYVDFIVQGEGEKAILDILGGECNERIIRNERIENLDALPFQPWDIFANLPYDYTCEWMDARPVFTMNTSRGCPYRCSFCSVSSIWGKMVTYFSASRIISEIEYLISNYGAKGIYFREDNFTSNIRRLREFCEVIIKKNLKFEWACETRVDTICDVDIIRLMSEAGCKSLFLVVESGSQKVLDLLDKNITVDRIEKVIRLCKEYDIRTFCSLIVGVPGETYEDYLLTQNMMDKLKPYAYVYNIFVGIPNSPLYRYCLEHDLYEYIDDGGLLYLPGYDIKSKFFSYKDSTCYVDYKFQRRTDFDKELINDMEKNKNLRKMKYLMIKILPDSIIKIIKKIKDNI